MQVPIRIYLILTDKFSEHIQKQAFLRGAKCRLLEAVSGKLS